jgi:hypothetical protein
MNKHTQHPLAELDSIILRSYHDLSLPPPSPEEEADWDTQQHQQYLSSNPDLTPAQVQAALSEMQDRKARPFRADISQVGPRTAIGILNDRVNQLCAAASRLGTLPALDHTYYGLLPGGGLDAHATPLSDPRSSAVLVPEGLFNLINLFCKLIVQLQPMEATADGPVYFPSAAFAQRGLATHPLIAFRHSNVLESYFQCGDPMLALPYTQALPFQDRFAYLLTGTEIYVLAHEAAHIVLGHLGGGADMARPEIEFAADAWAVSLLTEHFRSFTDFPEARASLCAFFFHSLNGMWERAMRAGFAKAGLAFHTSTHPPVEARLARCQEQFSVMSMVTPPWYGMVFNAIQLAAGSMADPVIARLLAREGGISTFHARALPRHTPNACFVTYTEKVWWRDIARLITSPHTPSRRLGLWFLLEFRPATAVGLYEGLLDEDPAHAQLCQQALIVVEPMYEGRLPGYIVRLRKAEAHGGLMPVIFKLSSWLYGVATEQLYAGGPPTQPMDLAFYADPADPAD